MINNLINKMNQKRKKGFTLIELIIVIAIIAILAAVALPKFAAIRENANVKADISNAKSIQNEAIALVSDDKFSGTGTITIALDEVASGDVKVLRDGLQNTPKVKASKNGEKGKYFFVTIDGNGDVTVNANDASGTKIYPDGASPYDGK